MRRDQLPPHKSATYVMPRWKAVYVSVPKAACTSLKWLVAGLQGEDPSRFHRSISRETGRAMTIHRRRLWRHTPMLHQLADAQLAKIDPEGGWFVFAVVRHPSARLFSGWQSKFLLREPLFTDRFADAPWMPRVPRTTQDVLEDFERFATSLAADPRQPVLRDRHFWPQHRLLALGRTPYTRIYETREIPRLLEDLAAHLRAQGWTGGDLELEPSNETPLRPLAAAFTPPVREAILKIYGKDFEAFGFGDVVPHALDPGDAYPDAVLAEIGRLVDRAERIGDLALRAQALQRELRERPHAPPQPAANRARVMAGRLRRRLAHRADL